MSTQPPVSDQEMPLLRTKRYIPAPRPQLVPRPRLIERLTGPLCDALTGQDDGRMTLEML
jgi:ATP/maltotriose-dependent transcriptional regulator MalT